MIEISTQVVMDLLEKEDIDSSNKITNHYLESIKKTFCMLQLELGISYKDIYDRIYNQEFSFHFDYELDKETNTELILSINNLIIEHHVKRSKYGPR
jgi:hypothetical protein